MSIINLYYVMSPLSGALIGYFTNWVAIKMLFRPHTEKYFLGRKLPFTPGLIPKRRKILAKRVAQTISAYLLTDEALMRRICGDDIKQYTEGILDKLLCAVKASEKTMSKLFFGEKDTAGEDFKYFAANISEYLSAENFLSAISKIDDRLSESDKKISGIFPVGLPLNIKLWISQNIPAVSDALLEIIASPLFFENVKPLVVGVIQANVKGLASLFVVPEKIFDNFYEDVVSYLGNPDNYAKTSEWLLQLYDKAMDAEVSGLYKLAADVISVEDGRVLSALAEKISGSEDAVFTEIKKSLLNGAFKQGINAVMSLKIKELLSFVDETHLEIIKKAIMSKFDAAVKNNLPAVLKALNIADIVEEKINEFEMQEAESIIISVVERELKAITYFGGLLGFVIGLVPPVLQSLGVR